MWILFFLVSHLILSVSSDIYQTVKPLSDNKFLSYCTAIMQNKNSIDDSINPHRSFAFWQGTGMSYPTSNFFTSEGGMFTKEWRKGSEPTEWSFNFTLFDGNYLDKNSARILFHSNLSSSFVYINELNATIIISNAIANVSFIRIHDYTDFTVHSGTLYVYFVEKETNRAPRTIEPENLKRYTMQLMFLSNEETGKEFSFSTTSFEDTFSISFNDKITCISVSLLYILFSFCTLKAPRSIERKMYNLTLQALFIFPWYLIFYIALWILKINVNEEILYWLIPFGIMIFLDLTRHFIILFRHHAFGCVSLLFAVIMGYFVALFTFTFPVVNVLFCFALTLNVVWKFLQRLPTYKYLTWLEIGQWGSISVWMAYINIYPTNIFLYSPKPVHMIIYFAVVLIQVIILGYLECKEGRGVAFRYTLTKSGLQKKLTEDDCAICYEDLKGSDEEKIYKTPCTHMFHAECLKKWVRTKLECPLCRAKLPTLHYILGSDISV